jgi:UDP-N-acetylmuramoylalanine--D-glutamate ligase
LLPEGPILLYGSGREAKSTRGFLAARAPDTEVYVTVDSGAVDVPHTVVLPPEEALAMLERGGFALVVKSPGVSRYKPFFERARTLGVPVTSNLNLWGASYREGRMVIAVTGTKGKSTTATITHLMLTRSGLDAGLAGNVGLAPLEIADKHAIVVFELSSYQTADMDFLPDIAAVTNLSPEHVDWHGSVERYYADKLRLIDRDGEFRIGLGRGAAGNPRVLSAIRDPARLLPPLDGEAEAMLLEAVGGSRLKGEHNFDNARLAARIALAAGASMAGIVGGIADFMPLPHRLEEHRIGGVIVVDDSISTTPEATKAALAAYRGYRIALIAGGHERQQDYAELASLLEGAGVTTLVCLPATGPRLATEARRLAPRVDVLAAEHLTEAIAQLARHRHAFDAVLLSPGAPSYNQLEQPGKPFKNFEERGRAFIRLAEAAFAGPRR